MITLTEEQAQQIEETLVLICKAHPEVNGGFLVNMALDNIRAARAQEQAEQEPVVMDESWCLEPQPVNGLLSKEQAEQEPMYISKYCVKSGCACHYSTAVDGEPVAVYTAPQPVSQEPVAETIKNNIFKAWGVK